jgi:hypothetical protein
MENIIRLKEKEGYWLTKYFKKFAIFEEPQMDNGDGMAKILKKLAVFDNLEDAEKYFHKLRL